LVHLWRSQHKLNTQLWPWIGSIMKNLLDYNGPPKQSKGNFFLLNIVPPIYLNLRSYINHFFSFAEYEIRFLNVKKLWICIEHMHCQISNLGYIQIFCNYTITHKCSKKHEHLMNSNNLWGNWTLILKTNILFIITQVACKKKTPKTTQHPKSKSLRKYQKLDTSLLLCNLFNNACIVGHVWSPILAKKGKKIVNMVSWVIYVIIINLKLVIIKS